MVVACLFKKRVRVLRGNGTRSEQIDFVGQGALNRSTTEFSSFFEDKWTVNDRLTLEYASVLIATISRAQTTLRHASRLPSRQCAMVAR
jgi:hypothetical protein